MVSMNMAARNHCSRPMARALHGHNVCAEISPKPLSGLNFQIEDSEKFGLESGDAAPNPRLPILRFVMNAVVRPLSHSSRPSRQSENASQRDVEDAFRSILQWI